MGTRNLTIVHDEKGKLKIAQYGQWDGYPEWAGVKILNFCKDKQNMWDLQKRLPYLKWMKARDLRKLYKRANNYYARKYITEKEKQNMANLFELYYFERLIHRDIGCRILKNITGFGTEKDNEILLENSIDFQQDNTFCEWAYDIDLQTNTLKCYSNGTYLLKTYDLDDLPTDEQFVSELRKAADEYWNGGAENDN